MNDFKAHADSSDIEKIEGLLKAGLYISNTMLVMEKDISASENDSECGGCSRECGTLTTLVNGVELYDTADLSEYLKANALGFGVMDSEEKLREELDNVNSAIYIIRKRKRIVSSVTTWDIDEGCIATENIFTIPSYRNRHLAMTILGTVLEKASLRGMTKARLNVYGDDTEAIALYHKLGFKVTKVLQEFSAYSID